MGIFSVMDIYSVLDFVYCILNTCEGRRKTMIKYNEFYGFILVYQIFGQVPSSWFYETYDEALRELKAHTSVPYRIPQEKAIACILNHKMEVVYKTEVGPDEKD